MATKPIRSDSGVQMATGTASWQGSTGVGGIYYKTGIGLVMRKTDNTEVTLGAGGGGGTLATTYAAGASTADSTLSLDATRGKVVLKDNAAPIGTLLELQTSGGTSLFLFNATSLVFGAAKGITTTAGAGAFDFSSATGLFSTSTGPNTLSGNVSLASGKTFVYAGGASTFDASASSGVFKTTSGAHTFGSAAWAVPANLVVTGGSSSTNTTGMSLVANVADGATSIAFDLNNSASLSTTGFKFMRWRNAGTEVGSITKSTLAAGGIRIVGDSASFLELSLNGATALGYNSNYLSVGGTTMVVNGAPLVSDTATTLGTTSNFWPSAFIARPVVKNQIIAAATSITVNPASGNYVRINLSATAITSLTISAGQTDGELMWVEVVEDATGTRTIPTTWTNVNFVGGTYTVTTTANKHDFIHLMWNGTAAKWYESSQRALNM